MALVQAHRGKLKGVKAEKWQRYDDSHYSRRGSSSSSGSGSAPPSLSSSVSSDEGMYMGEGSKGGDENGGISTLVLDSSGDKWMERWNRAFKTLEIEQLRSPMFFHVDPRDRDGMLAYTREVRRERDLWEISGCVGKELSKHKKKKMRSRAQ